MSVLACSKVGCENVMCDTYVPEVGYVCRDCQKDFHQYMTRTDGLGSDENEIKQALVWWLSKPKETGWHPILDHVTEFFKRYTQ